MEWRWVWTWAIIRMTCRLQQNIALKFKWTIIFPRKKRWTISCLLCLDCRWPLKNLRFVFFLEVILKFIDMVPEETRDEKYAEEFKDLKKRVIDALKKKDPDYAPWRMFELLGSGGDNRLPMTDPYAINIFIQIYHQQKNQLCQHFFSHGSYGLWHLVDPVGWNIPIENHGWCK